MPRQRHAAPSARTRVRRVHDRAAYDRATIDAVLDAGLICHLGFVHEGQPFVIPTLHARIGDRLYVHGSAASRTLRTLSEGVPACATVTLAGRDRARPLRLRALDELPLRRRARARDAGHRARREGRGARGVHREAPSRALRGRAAADAEGAEGDGVLSLPLDETSAKVRTGGPDDGDTPDAELDVWAGHIPLVMRALAPVPARGPARRDPGAARTRAATGAPASPAEPASAPEVPEHDRERLPARARSRTRGSGRRRRYGRPSSEKFWPKNPVTKVSGRNTVAITASCFVTALSRLETVER